VQHIFESAAMPYTRHLIARVPGAGEPAVAPPAPVSLAITPGPGGCLYAGQCARQQEICTERVPPLATVEPGHLVRCWFPVGHKPLDQTAEPDAQAVGAATQRKGA
jgi:oligopeptide/dipeptide ABC transporter ATP-binding protein